MRLSVVLAAGIVVAQRCGRPRRRRPDRPRRRPRRLAADQDISAAKRKKRARGHQAYGSGQQQIACTQLGCNPIPRGLPDRTGRIPFTWDPSGFDEVVCPTTAEARTDGP